MSSATLPPTEEVTHATAIATVAAAAAVAGEDNNKPQQPPAEDAVASSQEQVGHGQSTTDRAAEVKNEDGEGVAKESKVTPTTTAPTTSSTNTTTTNVSAAVVVDDETDSGGTTTAVVVNQLKCSLTLDKLPKRVRMALARNSGNNNKKVVPPPTGTTSLLTNGESPDEENTTPWPNSPSGILCQFCDRSFAHQDQYQRHMDKDHLTTNLGRRASGRAAAINSFPGCSLCNATATEATAFVAHSNDLDALFAHLVEKHADRYFACRRCNLRCSDAHQLAVHNDTKHITRIGRDRRKSIGGGGGAFGGDTVEGDKLERKVTRQSNSSQSSSNNNTNGNNSGESSALSRLAIAQNRFPLRGPARAMKGRLAANSQKANETRNSGGGRSGAKLTRSASASSTGSNTVSSLVSSAGTPPPGTSSNSNSSSSFATAVAGQSGGGSGGKNASLPASVFDDNFYETITVTVRRNLSKWMDGKIEPRTPAKQRVEDDAEGQERRPSPELLLDHAPPAVRSCLFRTPPVDVVDNEIHEATALAAITAFPTLLTAEQYGVEGNAAGGGKMKRRLFTKNSWKWKWDFVKKYKYVNEGGKIVKKAKEQSLGQRDLSKLDMWTQLTMRTKHEATKPSEESESSELETSTGSAPIGESMREEKRRQVNQLDTILDSRLMPQIVTEQNEQRLIKLEVEDEQQQQQTKEQEQQTNEAPVVVHSLPAKKEEQNIAEVTRTDTVDFPLGLQLRRNPNPSNRGTGLTLSGEWARPRCYVCFGCGAKFETVKLLQDHKSTEHPNTQTVHYEMVGRELIEGDLYRHLYIPKKAIGAGNDRQKEVAAATEEEKPQRGRRAHQVIAKIPDDAMVPCSKCKKDCAGRFELYRHMLDCVGDYAWLMAKKRFKYRYYGNRSRRRKSNARSIFGCVRAPKKTVKKERLERIKRRKMRSRRKPQKPSDAETIERMLANLPEKRISRTVATPPNSATKSANSGAITPAKSNPVAGSSTGRKANAAPSSSNKTTPTPLAVTSTTTSATGTKRNLRSTLEAETGKSPAVSTTSKGAIVAGKKGKVTATTTSNVTVPEKEKEKREVKNPAKVSTTTTTEKSESVQDVIKDGNIVPESPSVTSSRPKSQLTTIKSQQQSTNGKDAEKEGPSEEKKEEPTTADEEVTVDAVDSGVAEEEKNKKHETFMTRLASNTKGIIKKIGRKMKGGKKKGNTKILPIDEHVVEQEQVSEEKSNSPAAPFLGGKEVAEDSAQTPKKVLVKDPLQSMLLGQQEVAESQQTKAAGNAGEPKKLDESGSKENASAAVERELRTNAPITAAINIEVTTNNEKSCESSNKSKSTLSIPELFSPQISPSLSVPSNPSNLSSPMTSPTMAKRRVRKLNDCIARLTDKLQEKLAKPPVVAMLSPSTVVEPTPEPVSVPNVDRSPVLPPATLPVAIVVPKVSLTKAPLAVVEKLKEPTVPLDVPLNLSLKKDVAPSPSASNLLKVVTGLTIPAPVLHDCGVVDLSIRDKGRRGDSMQMPHLPALEITIPRVASSSRPTILPDVAKMLPIETQLLPLPRPPQSSLGLRNPSVEELRQLPLNLPPTVDVHGELIVPHVPKQMGNYEVIKIPTYSPQKQVKGSRRQQQANKVIPAPQPPPEPVADLAKKSSATSAIEKITELVADIVRNKKREAALKELAAAAAVLPLPVLPPIVHPVVPAVVSLVEEKDEGSEEKLPRTGEPKKTMNGGRKRGAKGKAAAIVEMIPVKADDAPVVKNVDESFRGKKSLGLPVEKEKVVEVPLIISENIPEMPLKAQELLMKVVETAQTDIPVAVQKKVVADTVPVIQKDIVVEIPEPTPVADAKTSNLVTPITGKTKATPKGKKKVVIVEQVEIITSKEKATEVVGINENLKTGRGRRKSTKAVEPVVKGLPNESKEDVVINEVDKSEEGPPKLPNGKVQRSCLQDKSGKENKELKVVEPEKKEIAKEVIVEPPSKVKEIITVDLEKKSPEETSKSPMTTTATTKVRKKRQSELAQILATQPVINNTDRDISLTRRKSVSFPETATSSKRVDSPKWKPSPPKKKKEEILENTSATEFSLEEEVSVEKKVAEEKEIPEAVKEKEKESIKSEIRNEKPTPLQKGRPRGSRKTKPLDQEEVEPPMEMTNKDVVKETPIALPVAEEEEPTIEEERPKNPTPKPKKKRRSELTQIIADQLLESFKEVDESQKDNLKILHDLSWADETMEIASRLKQSPIPRRQVTKKKAPVTTTETYRKSPALLLTKQPQASPTNSTSSPEQRKTATTPLVVEEISITGEVKRRTTATENMSDDSKKLPESITGTENKSLPIENLYEKELLKSSTSKISSAPSTSLFNTPVTAALSLIPNKPTTITMATKTSSSEEISPFWTKQNVVDKDTATSEKRLDWVSKASELSNNSAKSGNVSDDSATNNNIGNKAAIKSSANSSTFVLKPSRLQAIASPPLADSFDQLRNCDRSSTTSSSFCSPVVSPIGEPKKSLLNTLPTTANAFPTPVRSTISASNGTVTTAAAVNLLQFRDGPRDVDESDGDLEDNVSVHSSDSMESSMTSMTKSKVPRKRRKRSLLTKKKVRSTGAVKANQENGVAGSGSSEKFHCEICNKTFEKADRLAKHKITLTHISRLSELEFLNSQNGKVESAAVEVADQVERSEVAPTISSAVPEMKLSPPDSIPVLPSRTPEPQMVAVGTGAAVTPTPLLVPNHHRSPLMLGTGVAGMGVLNHHHNNTQSTLHNVHLEPISSPEQPQQSYLMSSSNTGGPLSSAGLRTENAFSAAMSHAPKRQPALSVSGLSQEEKLFYECCNMLKGSDRVGTQSENNSLTPRSNEAVSTWYSKTSTAFAIRSPTGSGYNRHNQRSPKYAFSKLDLNQFSDISSDSDNTYPSRGRPTMNGLGNTFGGGVVAPAMAPDFQNVLGGGREERSRQPLTAGSNCAPVGNVAAGGGIVSPLRHDELPTLAVGAGLAANAAVVYSDSDMGDSFPSSVPGASDNESYVRTILDRGANNRSGEWTKSRGAVEGAGGYRREEGFVDHSAAGKVKTKAAMKGFDNFRVSIPTDGLDLNQALNGGLIMHHNPHLDSKLASLADIALRNSTLPLIETAISVLHRELPAAGEEKEAPEKEESRGIATESLNNEPDDVSENDEVDDELTTGPETSYKSPTSQRRSLKNGGGRRTTNQMRTDKNSVGNRLGFKAKKRKGAEVNSTTLEKGMTRMATETPAAAKSVLDVYDFEDSQGSVEAPILPMKKCGKGSTGTKDSIPVENSVAPTATVTVQPVKDKPKPRGRPPKVKKKSPEKEEVVVAVEQFSQNSSDSFSDREDFNYNSPPTVEDSDLSSQESPIKLPSTPPSATAAKSFSGSGGVKKVAKKALDNVQKKCLIMGRIFKNNAQKNHKSEGGGAKAVPPPPVVATSAATVVEEKKAALPPVPKVELDKLFDSLKEVPPKRVTAATQKKTSTSILKKTERKERVVKKKVEEENEEDRQTKKLIEDLVNSDLAAANGDSGGQRKSKRKCIQQVNFVETWSSDEYEEFHSTKDIIAMIEANEKKAGPGRKKKAVVVEESEFELPIKKAAPAAPAKIQNRRKTIGFKETDDDLGAKKRKEISGRFSPVGGARRVGAGVPVSFGKDKSSVEGAKQVGRQKRVSSEKLYYWSSSSSAEEDNGGGATRVAAELKATKGGNGRVKGTTGGGGGGGGVGNLNAAEDEDNDSAMEQHGWIVGGSHKKLVTLLAHAKGKKSEVLPKK